MTDQHPEAVPLRSRSLGCIHPDDDTVIVVEHVYLLTAPQYSVPAPGAPQCEADGVRNGPDGPGGTEYYWSCTAPGTVDVDGTLMCDDHAGERGYGPKQEDYGYDPDDGGAA